MESWNEQLKTKILESELSLKEISDKTKIPTKFIEAIEKADFKKLPAEIFAKSQIERLLKFFGIDPIEAFKDYEEFLSPPDIFSEDADLEVKKSVYKNFLDNLKIPNINNFYIKYGSILMISIFLLVLMFTTLGDKENDLSQNTEIENTLEFLENESPDLSSTLSEEKLFNENESKNDLPLGKGSIEEVSPKVITRKIEIDIKGESWIVVFDKNERLLYELLQNGSYQLSGISPLRFKIGYAPATNLYIDDQKINFSRAIKGASNYAHFLVNEANKVESIRD
tara:strand:+ start:431 stop:1276 length:846 start_codon:yes stop_codon:yes gene_type:complete